MTKGGLKQASTAVGLIKSFSQKSGWGFIQLFENGIEDPESCKDVFFHRADVVKTGAYEIRPGVLVHCSVVSTGKGEKACDITIVDDPGTDHPSTNKSSTCMTCLGMSEDSLSHSPYGSEISTIPSSPSPPPTSQIYSYSLRSTGNFTTWHCEECKTQNTVQSIQRVTVVCASCALVHQVDSWICACSQINNRVSRHCTNCDSPFALVCQELVVQRGPGEELEQQEVALRNKKAQRVRTRWQHTNIGWSHPFLEAPEASLWCQDGRGLLAGQDRGAVEVHIETLMEKCRARLMWAYTWLTKKPVPDCTKLNSDWLYRFSEEVVKPEHRLLCTSNGYAAFVPNPCAEVDNPDVLHMYEALGMVLALAVALGLPLYPTLPVWLARSLLGYPTALQDLAEYDAALWDRLTAIQSASNLESLGLFFKEEVSRFGVVRVFEGMDSAKVTDANKHDYALWLKGVYLSKSVEAQLRQFKHGFFFALMGHHLMQTLTPVKLVSILNGHSL